MFSVTLYFNRPSNRLLHDARAGQPHEEAHNDRGDYLKAMVFGGLDGILTSFAIVAGAAGQLPLSPVASVSNGCTLSFLGLRTALRTINAPMTAPGGGVRERKPSRMFPQT